MILHMVMVAIGGFFGAIFRFGVNNWIKRKCHSSYPIATLIVNLSGSFLLGIIIGSNLDSSWRILLGTGFMGAFTTFSTFKLESTQLYLNKKYKVLILYLSVSYTIGILLAFIGLRIGHFFQ